MRLNIGERIISIRVFNGTATPVSITTAKLATPLFDGMPFWTPGPSGSSLLRSGATVALPVPLTAASCGQAAGDPGVSPRKSPTAAPSAPRVPSPAPAPSPAPEPTPPPRPTAARTTTPSPSPSPASSPSPSPQQPIVFLTLDGAEHQFPATDPHEVLSSLQHQDCLGQAAREVAELSLPGELDIAPDQRTAVVRLSVVPTGNGGDLELNSIRGTTLLAENPEQPWPRNVSIAGTDSVSVVEVSVLPARCDPHALAEDKAGTRLPVDITAGEWSGQLLLEPDEEFTRSVYAFVTAACAKEEPTESADRGK